MIKNIKQIDPDTITFTLGPTTIAFANTFRRILSAYIPVVAFDINSIKINPDETNTSLRKEYIEHRISMLPIDNSKISSKVDPSTITFEIKMENKNKEFEMLDVLGKDLVPNDKKVYFDPKFILLQLQPGQKLHLTANLKLFEKRTIVNRNNCMVAYTYSHINGGLYNFNFTLESFNSIPVNDLLKLGKETFNKVFQEFLDKVDTFTYDPKLHRIRIITDDPHTFGNIITQDILLNPPAEQLDYCGYRQPHPTENICEIKIESEKIDDTKSAEWLKSLIIESLNRIIKTL